MYSQKKTERTWGALTKQEPEPKEGLGRWNSIILKTNSYVLKLENEN